MLHILPQVAVYLDLQFILVYLFYLFFLVRKMSLLALQDNMLGQPTFKKKNLALNLQYSCQASNAKKQIFFVFS